MKKIITFLFFLANIIASNGQIAFFNFNISPYLSVTSSNQNLEISNVSISSGTINVNQTTTSFQDKPYIESNTGWTSKTQNDAKCFIFTITAKSGYTFSISNISFEAYVTSAGPSAVGISINDNSVYSSDIQQTSITKINQTISGQNDLTSVTIKIQGWQGSRTTSGSGYLRIDNITVNGSVIQLSKFDKTSIVSLGEDLIPDFIPSTCNTENNLLQVFDVKFTDLQSGDGVSTIINKLIFTQGNGNKIQDWTKVIAGAYLFGPDLPNGIAGTINQSNITFEADKFISVAEGVSNAENYKLKIYLKKDLSNITDKDNLVFKLNYSDIFCDESSSCFGSGVAESGDTKNAIEIRATKIIIANQPEFVLINALFGLTIKAVDDNQNTDIDFAQDINLELNNGTGKLTSPSSLQKKFLNGVAIWNDLKYNSIENFTIKAVTTNLPITNAVTNQISCVLEKFDFKDNFEDGNITDWIQSTSNKWIATANNQLNGLYSLQHKSDDQQSGTDQISHIVKTDLSTETKVWRFQVKHEYQATSSNCWGVFLLCDKEAQFMKPSGNENGYVLGVHYAGSDNYVKLWKISNGTATEMINTNYSWDTNIGIAGFAGIEVTRTSYGNWSIKIDANGGFDKLKPIGTGFDNSFNYAEYFGIYYKYSSSNIGKLTIDDVYIGSVIPDITPPSIENIIATSPTNLKIFFSEPISKSYAENISNYSVNNNINNPISVNLNPSDNSIVELNFSNQFINNQIYQISVQGIQDENENRMQNSIVEFSYKAIRLEEFIIISPNQIDLKFSKTVNKTTATALTNFLINNSIGNPASAIPDVNDATIIHLSFVTKFTQSQNYLLTIQNIQDEYGNSIELTSLPFTYYEPQFNDITINEIMADVNPTPTVLPAHKYIELYNNSNYEVNLKNWTFTIGSYPSIVFPSTKIAAHDYVIICAKEAQDFYSLFGIVIPVLNQDYLTTTGKNIILKNNTGNIISSANYNESWYKDDSKKDGGWSLEKIDPENGCSEIDNWAASKNYMGGTPGRKNSVFAQNQDTQKPQIISIIYINSKQIEINYNEPINIANGNNTQNYKINSLSNPVKAIVHSNDNSKASLYFSENFNQGTNQLSIVNISDKCGNSIDNTTVSFTYRFIKPDNIEVKSSTELKVIYTEKVDKNSAENINNYTVDNSISKPVTAIISKDSLSVNLIFSKPFVDRKTYTLSVANVKDINQNTMQQTDLFFTYFIPAENDIVFNEIMCDVNPVPANVPAYQFIELYNRNNFDINLSDWTFTAESQTTKKFPSITIKAKDYVILCHPDAVSSFSSYGTAIGLLSSTDLNSTGKQLILKDNSGKTISQIKYSNSWITDDSKKDGGWSIERIDPDNFCGTNSNWSVTKDITGATPGKINSVFNKNQDNTAFNLINYTIQSSNHIMLQFNKPVKQLTALNQNNYLISNQIGKPVKIQYSDTSMAVIYVFFANQFIHEQTYELSITGLSDECSNILASTNKSFTYKKINPQKIWVISDYQLKIQFSEKITNESVNDTKNYIVDNEIGNPELAVVQSTNNSYVYLQFTKKFIDGKTYKLTIKNIKDQNENTIDVKEFDFAYYFSIKPNDIVINEILFNPKPGSSDFVELCNRSNHTIDLKYLKIATRDDKSKILKDIYNLTENSVYLKPEEYIVISTNSLQIKTEYTTPNQNGFIDLNSLPSFPDDAGTVVILNSENIVIDEFAYSEKMHLSLLKNTEGVSLERINFDRPSNDKNNWHSAAENVGYATPAYKNSQYLKLIPDENEIKLSKELFSPDNDGTDDFIQIHYKFNEPGYVSNVTIFDSKGRLIRRLTKNELLSTEGDFCWDGTDETGAKVKIGIYLIYIEVFDISGNVKKYKKTCVVAGRL